jgi:hypothetical protein
MRTEQRKGSGLKRRDLLLGGTSIAAASSLPATGLTRFRRNEHSRRQADRAESLADRRVALKAASVIGDDSARLTRPRIVRQ